jgi:hypothetical protein
MACNNINCGCTTAGKTTLPGCDPFVCNDPNPCSSVVDSCCVIYTGDDIVDANITTGQSLCDIIPQLVTYMTPPVVTCSTPTNCCGSVTGFYVTSALDPTDPTKAVFSFTWDRKENCEVSWIIQYRISSTIPWTSVSVPNFLSSFSIANLLSGVSYEFRMYAECIGEPCYSITVLATSPIPPCNTPGYCGSSVIYVAADPFAATQTSLTWNWPQNPSAVSYYLELVSGPSITSISLPQSPSPTYTAVGLSPNTLYQLYVYSVCPDGIANTLCGTFGEAQLTLKECVQVTITNGGLSKDIFGVKLCNQPYVTQYSLDPGNSLTLCVQENTFQGLNNTTRVIVLGPCP